MPRAVRSQSGKLLILLLVCMFITLSCSEKAGNPPAGPTISLPAVKLQDFGVLPTVKPTAVTPALQEQPVTLDKAINYKQVLAFWGVKLTPAQQKFLEQHRFLLIPKSVTRYKGQVDLEGGILSNDEMLDLFDVVSGGNATWERLPENCHLVNPDVVLNAFHKYLENSLQFLEKTELAGMLKRFLINLQAAALKYKAAASGPLAVHYELIAAQLTVPLVILDNAHWSTAKELEEIAAHPEKPMSDEDDTLAHALNILDSYKGRFSAPVFDRMVAELRLIYGAKEVKPSPLYGQYAQGGAVEADYTQFTPRSHYVKNSILRSYFRAMMYLGKNSYLLGKPDGVGDAMLVTLLLASPGPDGQPLLKDWQRLMEITSFFAGRPDDISYPEWRNFLVKVLGTDKLTAGQALDPAILKKISQNLGELQGPRILSDVIIHSGVLTATKKQLLAISESFRIFSQRFTFDAWVLNRLTAGQEQTSPRLPSMPSALFVPAAFGDKTAKGFVDQYLQRLSSPFTPAQVTGFNGQLHEVAADLKKVKDPQWYSSVGSAWLKVLGTLTSVYGPGYPLYMQDQLFPVKQVESFLGSYTELKHDTLLYAKQCLSEMGGGDEPGPPPPVPKGFVEPNLPFWHNLARLVNYVDTGFKKYGLLKNDLEKDGPLNNFKQDIAFYSSMAAKELQGTPLTEKEYEDLRTKSLGYMARPVDPTVNLEEKDKRAGLITDLHTDAKTGHILYEATAQPYIMLVLVSNDGTVRLASGVAYNHYEFTGPLATRYTDADWQGRVYEHGASLPPKNFWYQCLAIH